MPKRMMRRRYKKVYRKRRRQYIPKALTSLGKTYTFRRSRYINTLLAVTTAAVFQAYAFTLSDLPNYTEFTNLYDEYKINWVRLRFIPYYQTAIISTANNMPWVIYVVDTDDNDVTGYTNNDLLQYSSCKITVPTRGFTKKIYPKFATEQYISAVATGYGGRRGYLDCASATIPHYGFKIGIAQAAYNNQFGYQVFADYCVTFKGSR